MGVLEVVYWCYCVGILKEMTSRIGTFCMDVALRGSSHVVEIRFGVVGTMWIGRGSICGVIHPSPY